MKHKRFVEAEKAIADEERISTAYFEGDSQKLAEYLKCYPDGCKARSQIESCLSLLHPKSKPFVKPVEAREITALLKQHKTCLEIKAVKNIGFLNFLTCMTDILMEVCQSNRIVLNKKISKKQMLSYLYYAICAWNLNFCTDRPERIAELVRGSNKSKQQVIRWQLNLFATFLFRISQDFYIIGDRLELEELANELLPIIKQTEKQILYGLITSSTHANPQ